jgi:hypothetical protein
VPSIASGAATWRLVGPSSAGWPSRSGSIGSALQRPPRLPSAGWGFKSDLEVEDLSALRDANLAHDQAGVIRDYPNLAVVSATERTDNIGVSSPLTAGKITPPDLLCARAWPDVAGIWALEG